MTATTLLPDLVVQYPSADFPAPPMVRLTVPREWEAVPQPDAVMAVRSAAAIDGYRPNVAVRVHAMPASELNVDRPKAFDTPEEFELVDDQGRDFGGMPARASTVRHAVAGRLLQARRFVVLVSGTEHVAHAVSVTGTYPATSPLDVVEQVNAIVESLLVQVVADAGVQ